MLSAINTIPHHSPAQRVPNFQAFDIKHEAGYYRVKYAVGDAIDIVTKQDTESPDFFPQIRYKPDQAGFYRVEIVALTDKNSDRIPEIERDVISNLKRRRLIQVREESPTPQPQQA